MSDTKQRIASLPPEKRALLIRQLQKRGGGETLPPLRRRQPGTGPVVCSFSQQRLWFLEQLQPGTASNNLPLAVRLKGHLEAASFERALTELLRRHESLRTTFRSEQGQPVQVIQPPAPLRLRVVELSSHESPEQEARRLAAREAQQPFDLAAGPMLRALLLSLSEQEHVLVLNMHHIASDEWSMSVLLRELTALYDAFRAGRDSPLPELALQYADFALWQREWLQGKVEQEQLEWWRRELAGAPGSLELPTDNARPPVRSFRGGAAPVSIPLALSEALKALCRKEGVTPFMALLAAYQALLGRLSGQKDVCVGSPVAGRRFAELEGLIGFFVNTLVFRGRLQGDPSYRMLLARAKEMAVGALAHQDLPFERLVEELHPTRDLGRTPLFQVLFALREAPRSELASPWLSLELMDLQVVASRFDLELNLSDTPQGFVGALLYSADLFHPETAARFVRCFVALLEGLVTCPERPLSQLPLLPHEEQQQVLVEWNDTRLEYPRESTIPELFERVVASTPEAIALEFGDTRLTYRQLDARANQLAWRLRTRGVGPDVPVALCLERSVELIVSLLAILKAGGAYVPLDASYPAQRLGAMLEDSRPKLLLSTRTLYQRLPASGLPTLLLDESSFESEPTTAPDSGVEPLHLAYIDFTSGSTGRPKGVCINHRGVLRTVLNTPYAESGPQHSFLLIAPISFDASTLEVWGPLLNGGRLVVFPPESPSDGQLLSSVLARHGVSTLHLTAGLLTHMVDGHLEGLRGVKQLLTGGDVVSASHVRRVLSTLHIPVTACYGPTENTLFTSCFRMTEASQVPASVPIGRPIGNTQVYVLDEHLQPVPPGVTGELYTSGDGLARGYLDAQATAERFLPNPLSPTPGARMYRTGDLARWRPDGVLEFLGRGDSQVKVRGFRIELAEVNAALQAHPSVREALSMAREDVPGNKLLVAYVVAHEGQVLDASALRSFLLERLPEYMVPSAFVSLPAFPLTANGKVDRKALPAPEGSLLSAPAFVAPRTPTEELLASLLSQLLRTPRVGALDNFFALGGHSLLATQVVSRIRSTFGVELPLRALFEAPTVAALAERIDALSAGQGAQALPRPVPQPRTGPLPLSFAQQRLWFLEELHPGSTAYNMSLALRLEGELDTEALRRSFDEILRRHESLRTVFQGTSEGPLQLISPPAPFELPVVDLTSHATPGGEALRLATEEAQQPFNLSAGPLFRARLLRVGAREHVLIATVHHIVSDGWSMGVLNREISTLYQAFSAGQPSPLPELPLQYADFAAWQRQWLQGEVLERELEWWRTRLEGRPPLLELPTDRPRTRAPSQHGAHLPVRLSPALSSAVEALCRQEGITPFMAFLGALQALLARYSGQEDISVGTSVAGRSHTELEGLIGFFLNTLVLRTRLGGNPTVSELLGRVREVTLGAYAHQHVPYEHLQPMREVDQAPPFQVLLMLQNLPEAPAMLPGLEIQPLQAQQETAKFDLSLTLWREAEAYAGVLEYSTDLFEQDTIARMVRHLESVLEGMVARPEQRLSALPLLSEEERRRLLVEWNGPRTEHPAQVCAHHLFEAQVERTPEATAVVGAGESATYRELEAWANRLAHHLRALGVGPEVRVGVCLERSVHLVGALLAVLKAGGAYVPLDSEYPAERLGWMLEDSGVQVVVATSRVRERLARLARAVWLDEEAEALAARSDERPHVPVPAEAAAYVLYTSGSTGRPKGVVVEHRSLANLVRAARELYPVAPGERVLQFASVSWDTSAEELYACLTQGGTLVLRSAEALGAPESFLGWCQRMGVTQVNLPTAFWHQLVASLEEGSTLPGFRWVVIGGERAAPERVARWQQQVGSRVPLLNTYGLTEVTAVATATDLSGDRQEPWREVPIGRPLPNVRVYVVDAWQQPVPVGVVGELLIGGAGLARGYLERPELTAERFVPDPFSEGGRLYRTGDRARWRADGRLEYLGRADAQVKIRGHRVEPGEVEALLLRHPGVKDAAVVARQEGPAGPRLVAYAVPAQGERLEPDTLRRSLREQLPEFMVPSALVVLEALPLNPNGKVDRKALPPPEAEQRTRGSARSLRTQTEELLAGIWAGLLGVPSVGAEDDFFELGGHSLLATQALSRMRSTFGVELPLRTLFEHPTLESLARAVESARQSGEGLHTPALARHSRTGPVPLSFAQQRLWFLHQLEPESAAYNMPLALAVEGALEVTSLERAFTELVRRHESLRTSFVGEQGDTVQVISPPGPFALSYLDLSSHPTAEVEARRLAAEDAVRPFDLARGPLLRASLLRLGEQRHVLLLNMHHITSDDWSLGVLVREVGALYQAFSSGQSPAQPELPLQYADYTLWQRQWLQGEALEAQLAFWRQQLAGAPHALELPTDFPRPPVQSFRGASVPVALGRLRSDMLKILCQKAGATPFMGLLATFQALLSRYSGQEDISVGSPIAGRRFTELEGLIGFFINTLVLRTRLQGRPSFRELLARVRDTTLSAYAHQDLPFERLVEELQPQRDLSRTPLFQVLFVLQNAPLGELSLPGLSFRLLPPEGSTAKFDLTLSLSEGPEGFTGSLEYSTALLREETARRLMAHFLLLLDAALENPEAALGDTPLLSEEERRQQLVDWSGPRREYPPEHCLHTLFESQVDRTPQAVALRFEGQSLTYAELNARANRLAWRLASLGVGPESRVAVCLERSVDMVVSLLASLKAGAAYVPLDPAYPRQRLQWMLEDSLPQVLLTHQHLSHLLPEHSAHALVLDAPQAGGQSWPEDNLPARAHADNLAYVIFTSGSTGRPKGAMNSHRAICNRLLWMQEAYGLTSEDAVLQKTPFSFDVSVWEFFWPLLTGARLVVARPGGHQEPAYLAALISQERVTTLHFVPPMLQAFLQEPRLEHSCASVQRILCSGEALPAELARRCQQQLPHARLYNLYGPTEAAVDVTAWACSPSDTRASVPIGQPVSNTYLLVLDSRLRLVPVGVPGELYIGGVQVGRGYLSRPELTAERFLPDPFSPTPGARLYRTGDLARWLPEGSLDYLGRLDFQVKVRGFRIELGEVEAALLQAPEVREAVVVAREEVPGDRRLVAYVVARPGTALEAQALRSWLVQRLPEHMVPSAFVPLEALPLSPNGKVDRKALPAPVAARSAQRTAPRTDTEHALAAMWRELLRVEEVGAEDDFFALGGHSLLATQLVSRVRGTLGVELPVRALFEAPTVAALAARLDSGMVGEATLSKPVPQPRTGALPLSFAQQRLWFLHQLEPDSAAYNIPAAFRLEGRLEVHALEHALSELLRRHESLRTTFPSVEGDPQQLISAPAPFTLPVVELSSHPAAEAEARRLAMEEAARPFELSRGPLLRASLVRLGEESHLLLMCLHHIISDGWSMGVLVRELATLYQASLEGWPSPLPEPRLQYADFATWQRQWLRGEVLEAQLTWWRQQLQGANALLELPTDRPRPATQSFRGASLPLALSARSSQALKSLALQERSTPFMALLAALSVLLHRYSGQGDISVGSPIAGRRHSELEGLIGLFVNTLVLRVQLAPEQSFRQLLGRVRESVLGAFAHQDVPFERLVDALQPSRSLSHSPLFQVLFTLQNAPEPTLQLPGLSFTSLATPASVAQFDLSFTLAEGPQGFSGSLEYSTALFDESTAARLASHLRRLVESVVEHPELPLRDLSLLSEEELRQLLVDFNDSRAEHTPACIHALFQAQVARTPQAPALLAEGEPLSYAALNLRANQLAHHLLRLGVTPDTRVALSVLRSSLTPLGLLGILKSGGAYVPLDPAYPAERLAFMLEDSGARVLVTQRSLAGSLPASHLPVVFLDELPPPLPSDSEDPATATTPDNLAYVIYTSGSTGRPKGVEVPHRTVSNFLSAMDGLLGASQGGTWLAVTSTSFDISVLELLWTLTRGFRVHVHPDPADVDSLAQALRHHRATHLQGTPSLAKALLMDPRAASALSGLPYLLLGGEALPPALARQLLALQPGTLLNLYGPTETTVWSSFHPVRSAEGAIPLGRPLANNQLYVLDTALRPTPLGVPGELFIAGEGVVRGYHARAALTAERFLPDPFSQAPGARMYRTGDLARWRPEGVLEFLGRVDSQVKVRGFRIELGEVESALGRHPDVREAVALAREEGSGNKRLVAYVVAQPGRSLEAEALRTFLARTLPEHMVPSAFVSLEALPLTPNGKVDRKALPALEGAVQRRKEYVAPRTEAEQRLARLWSEVLGQERIGLRDSFFELGGDSLMSVRVAAMATEQGLPLQVRQLFQHKTLGELAAALEREPSTPRAAPAGSSRPAGDEELPMLPQQQWLVETFDVEAQGWAATLGWDMPEPMHVELLKASLALLDAQHDALRMRLVRGEQGWGLRMLASSGEPRVEEVDLSNLEPQEQRAAIIEVARRLLTSLSITRGPALAMALCRLGGSAPDKLLLSIHHSLYDAYCLPMLLEDFRSTYVRLASGQPLRPLPVSSSYREYVLAMEGYRRSEAMEQARAFWLHERRLRPLEPMPVDMEGGQHTDLNTRRVTLPLPPALAARLVDYMRDNPSVSFNELLLFGVVRAWSRWAGPRALRMDVENNGRGGLLQGVDLSRTLGPTTIKFPILFDVPAHLEPRAALEEVRRTLQETLPHAVGYGLLRYGQDPEARRLLAACGSPQVFFNNRGASLAQPRQEDSQAPQAEYFSLKRADGQANIISYDLMIECDGAGPDFRMSWVYSSQLHRDETMRALARGAFEALAELTSGGG